MRLYVYMCVCMCLNGLIRAHVASICVNAFIRVYVLLYVYTRFYMCKCASICVNVNKCVSICVDVNKCISICARTCIYVCVFITSSKTIAFQREDRRIRRRRGSSRASLFCRSERLKIYPSGCMARNKS